MISTKLKFAILQILLMLASAAPALAEGGGGGDSGGNQQSPVEVIAQIVITAIILRVMSVFRLP
ncbi:hypothetical protein [Chamaesiphon sp. VAR_69_metabat_338]|uniref:hypothetical protein n=1 Tax=Chamaesiphon sp. VAR_69_metabat_338 TaxID=2964704 RepID=UPI00286E9A46|nr:hypothetical protein [Chamaesiphon sp. VAR_69_metabat_338]